MGGSAGGHLALMVAYTSGHAGLEPDAPYPGVSSHVGAVINMNGITNVFTRVVTDPKGQPTKEPRHFIDAERTFGPDRETWRVAMPVSHVSSKSPPTLVLHGRADTTVDYLQAIELTRRLADHNVPHQLVLLEDIGHTFNFAKWGKVTLKENLRPLVLTFLRQHLR